MRGRKRFILGLLVVGLYLYDRLESGRFDSDTTKKIIRESIIL